MSRMIKVILWGEEVGRLLWDERKHLSYFTFNPDFLSKGIDIAPLTAYRSYWRYWEQNACLRCIGAYISETPPFHSGFSSG